MTTQPYQYNKFSYTKVSVEHTFSNKAITYDYDYGQYLHIRLGPGLHILRIYTL